jgi:hypothetical protein
MAQQIQQCPKGKLSIVGGGGAAVLIVTGCELRLVCVAGGGTGFTMTGMVMGNNSVSAYGGGVDLKFMNADALANDAECGGKLLESKNDKSGNYQSVDQVTTECRKQCQPARDKSLSAFWQCTCPCTREGFQHLNLTFAAKMHCA